MFRHSVTHWWNDLPDDVILTSTFPSTLYQDTRWCVVRSKKPARHTVSILTGRKKMHFSHLCSSVIPYPIGTKFATDVPASYGSLHIKCEEIRSSHFRDTSEQKFVLISSFFLLLLHFAHFAKSAIKHECVLQSGCNLAHLKGSLRRISVPPLVGIRWTFTEL